MLTLPNLLTVARVVAIPPVVGLLFWPGLAPAAAALFALICLTDWLDGRLARQWGQVSAIGTFLDPIADKLLVAAVLMALVAVDRVAGWTVVPAILILLREVLISGLREHLAGTGLAVPVSRLAKWKTAVQMLALTVLILADGRVGGDALATLGALLLWLAAALTLVTGWDYLSAGIRHMLATDRGAGDRGP